MRIIRLLKKWNLKKWNFDQIDYQKHKKESHCFYRKISFEEEKDLNINCSFFYIRLGLLGLLVIFIWFSLISNYYSLIYALKFKYFILSFLKKF